MNEKIITILQYEDDYNVTKWLFHFEHVVVVLIE